MSDQNQDSGVVAFGIHEAEAERFAYIAGRFYNNLHVSGGMPEQAATAITAAWVQSTIQGVYHVSAENLRRENTKKPQAEQVDYLKDLRGGQ